MSALVRSLKSKILLGTFHIFFPLSLTRRLHLGTCGEKKKTSIEQRLREKVTKDQQTDSESEMECEEETEWKRWSVKQAGSRCEVERGCKRGGRRLSRRLSARSLHLALCAATPRALEEFSEWTGDCEGRLWPRRQAELPGSFYQLLLSDA